VAAGPFKHAQSKGGKWRYRRCVLEDLREAFGQAYWSRICGSLAEPGKACKQAALAELEFEGLVAVYRHEHPPSLEEIQNAVRSIAAATNNTRRAIPYTAKGRAQIIGLILACQSCVLVEKAGVQADGSIRPDEVGK